MPTEPQKYDAAAIQKRFAEMQQEIEAIRERAKDKYRHEAGEQYTPMLKDIRTLLGQLNVIDENWTTFVNVTSVISARIIMTEPQLLDEQRLSEIEAQLERFLSALTFGSST